MTLAQNVHDAAVDVLAATNAKELADRLNALIRSFVGWPFTVSSASVRDVDGNQVEQFGSVIHVESKDDEQGIVLSDRVAAVFEVIETLDVATLRSAFERIAAAKRLKKSPPPKVAMTTTVTLGVIVALNAGVPLEMLASELDRLNQATLGRERVDVVAVISTGLISYAVQFPGESLTGDYLPPAEGAVEAGNIPPWYIVMVIRPTGTHTLNRVLSFVTAHLGLFSPGAKLHNWMEMLDGVVKEVVTVTGYQFNLRGELVPVPRQFYNDRYLAPLPIHLESQKRERLASVRFLPWQDGGVISMEGKFPLEGLLVFLGAVGVKQGVIKLAHVQLSFVLPISEGDFGEMLNRFQRQSNMLIVPEQPNFVIKKVADEGSTSPFMARLMLGMFFLRDLAFPDPATRNDFDKAYEIALTTLFAARTEMQEVVRIWPAHTARIASGDAAQVRGPHIHVSETIDRELKQHCDAFLTAATRALKQGMQGVASTLGMNVGFLFQKPAHFERELATLRAHDQTLGDYLLDTRTMWSERLVNARNDVEHNGWTLPDVVYKRAGERVEAIEPLVAGMPVTQFVADAFDRLACFVEELSVYGFKRRFPPQVVLTELPLADRDPEKPERFRVTIATGGRPPWTLAFHVSRFEET
jgi:hypothetical protein